MPINNPDKGNVLVTSCASKVELIKSLKQACDSYDIKLFSSDIDINKPALYFSHDYIVLPKLSDPIYITKLISMCKENGIKNIIPTRDEDLIFFSKNKHEIEKEKIFICQSSAITLKTCNDKFLFRQYCDENNLPIPQSYSEHTSVQYPCILKCRHSSASQGVHFIENKEQLHRVITEHSIDDYILEEFISDKEYSIDAFFDLNGKFVDAVARERCLVVGGESKVSKTVKNDNLINVVKTLGNKLSFVGHITTQAFCSSDGRVNLIEVNPRFGGASNLSIVAGLDSPYRLVAMLCGDFAEVHRPRNIQYNMKMLRYSTDLFINE